MKKSRPAGRLSCVLAEAVGFILLSEKLDCYGEDAPKNAPKNDALFQLTRVEDLYQSDNLLLRYHDSNTEAGMATDAEDRLIRLPEVLHLSGLSRSAVYQMIKLGAFPAQVKTSVRSSAWVLSEVVAWKNARIAARDS